MNRILIVRLGALGDIVHALPAAAALRDAFPDARLDWLVDVKHRAILDLVPVLDTRIAVDPRAWSGARAVPAVVRDMRRTQYDVAFDLQGLIKSAVFARASGARRVIGYAAPHLREAAARYFYTEHVDVDVDVDVAVDVAVDVDMAVGAHVNGAGAGRVAAPAPGMPCVTHVVDKALAALRAVGIDTTSRRFPIDEPWSPVPSCTRQLLGLWPDEPFAVINPGAAWPNKRWPAERFGALASELRTRHGLKSAVVWGPGEETLAARVAAASSGAAGMAPATTLADLIALVRAARIVISGDTGPVHLAAAVGTPVVGIYGPTDPRRNGPWSADDESISRFDRCACHHQRQCRIADWCLAAIAMTDVLQAVERRLAHVR